MLAESFAVTSTTPIITPIISVAGIPVLSVIIGFAAILFAAVTDIRTREVPDWLNFSLLAFAIGNAILLSISGGSWSFIIDAATGFAFGLIIGMSMFYAGQWGGGDSKLIISLSALIGIDLSMLIGLSSVPLIVIFLIDLMVVGAIYGLCYSLVLAIINFRKCKDSALEAIKKKKLMIVRMVMLLLMLASFVNFLFRRSIDSLVLVAFSLLLLLVFYLWLLVSTVEKSCMIRDVKLSGLTEGDWIVSPVMKGKRLLLAPTKTGVSREEIALLKKNKIRSVVVKVGIPFVPSFLIAYILLFLFGNWLAYFF